MANGVKASISDFRVTTDTTATDSSKDVWVVIEILDADGKVDPFAYQGLAPFSGHSSGLKVDVASLLGTVESATTYVGADDRGVVITKIDYDATDIGRDTVSVTVTKSYYSDQGTQLYQVIGSKTVNINVTAAPNQAEELRLSKATIVASTLKTNEKSVGNETTTGLAGQNTTAAIWAGRSIALTIDAYKHGGTSREANQNGEVTVKFVGTSDYMADNGTVYSSSDSAYDRNRVMDSSDDCVVKTYTVDMVNGQALLTIPEGDITEAGLYKIYLSMDTSVKTAEKDYVADGNATYYLRVLPGDPAKLDFIWPS
jgi:hypothetical protein